MASVARSWAAFTNIRKILRGRLLWNNFPTRLFISHNNEEKEFLDAAEDTDYVKETVIPTTEVVN